MLNLFDLAKKFLQLSNGHKIKSYHHADSRFVVVSAASILAKVSRDKSIERLRKIYNLGSGYPSDTTTVKFVTKF
jgi:RNase HII (EC 3.1.26.4)